MILRPTAIVVVTSGLMVAAGFTSGCQLPRAVQSWEARSFPWRRLPEPRSDLPEDQLDSETYVPEVIDTPRRSPEQPTSEQPNLRLPSEPSFTPEPVPNERLVPVPPALEFESPQARRWTPSRPNNRMVSAPQPIRESESATEDLSLPPARVTYDSEATSEEPDSTASPEQHSSSQPRLFRPAGTAKNMFDSVKRKFTR